MVTSTMEVSSIRRRGCSHVPLVKRERALSGAAARAEVRTETLCRDEGEQVLVVVSVQGGRLS